MLVRVVVAAALLARGASLAPLRSTATRTPHSGYHGQGQIDFFEGWFSRLTLPDKSVALIYAVFDPGKKTPRSGVEAQILIAGADATATTVRASADTSRFAAAPHDLSLRYAFDDGDAFSMTSRRHQGRVGDVSWSFSVEPRVGWGGNFGESRQYSTAGWLAALGPLLSPHYQATPGVGSVGSRSAPRRRDTMPRWRRDATP